MINRNEYLELTLTSTLTFYQQLEEIKKQSTDIQEIA